MVGVHRRRSQAGGSLSPPIVRRIEATASELHAVALPERDQAEIWVCRPLAPALVMGSAQRRDQFDEAALADASIELASRRSGGGAVFIDPDAVVWIDVVAPRTSVWWSDDLGDTFLRVGQCWQQALGDCGVAADVIAAPPARGDDAARAVCWAGVGWGEVVIDGVKIVGLSQRRTRWGARVQAMAVLDGRAARAADWFVDVESTRRDHLRGLVGSHPLAIELAQLEAAVIARLVAAS